MSQMNARNLWVFQCMPLEKTDRIDLAFNEIVYNDTVLDRAPEEAVPTLVTKQLQARKESLIRWNKGAETERNLYLTPKGKIDFWSQQSTDSQKKAPYLPSRHFNSRPCFFRAQGKSSRSPWAPPSPSRTTS